MKQNFTVVSSVSMIALLAFVFLYQTGFFMADERDYPTTSAYIDGATPTEITIWEMY